MKLVAEVGVGTVAAGVSKAHATSCSSRATTAARARRRSRRSSTRARRGSSASPRPSRRWCVNGLRDRIVVQFDGQLKTGRDVVIAALLGAEEFGFATAPLVVTGCVMMRVCHLDTCPVGIATQNPELRKRFTGKPEFVVNFFEFIAEEVREHLAALGFRSIAEAVGHAEVLDTTRRRRPLEGTSLDLSPILEMPPSPHEGQTAAVRTHPGPRPRPGARPDADRARARRALEDARPVHIELPIRNVQPHRRHDARLRGHPALRRRGPARRHDQRRLRGSAGQSFGAFVPRGITLRLEGDANDYFGKGLSGGRLVLFPDKRSPFVAEENIIAGNVALYGATSGEALIRGVVGERFCVRNSGATAVVEGVGDHGCEYMTGGRVVVLGATGRNFGAGMSGGIAYVYDPTGMFPSLVNYEMVELEPLDDVDIAFLRRDRGRHAAETDSAVANALLAEWDDALAHFHKVMPKDYKRVLDVMREAEELDISEAETAGAGDGGVPWVRSPASSSGRA